MDSDHMDHVPDLQALEPGAHFGKALLVAVQGDCHQLCPFAHRSGMDFDAVISNHPRSVLILALVNLGPL